MTRAIIGHTGFVGGTLARSWNVDATFNSKNIEDIVGRRFDLVACAGVSAEKWRANQDPEGDRAAIGPLIRCLEGVSATRFVLISTVDVYPNPRNVTEADPPEEHLLQPYGLHRLEVERFVREHFPNHLIVRLPGLFGRGLKKNVVFDMLNARLLDRISPRGCFQWYPMARFARDLDTAIESGLPLVNFAVEPVATSEIHELFFSQKPIGADDLPAASYDVRTQHAELLGGSGHYHLTKTSMLDEMARFVADHRSEET